MLRPRQRKQMQPARKALLLAWLAELAMLGECFGHATARLWHERIRPDLDRLSSNRQWERLKVLLQAHGVPHERVAISEDDAHEAPGACGLRLLISREQVDGFGEPTRKRCAAARCLGAEVNGVFGPWFPPRRPHYYRDPTRRDGLTRLCATCHRAACARRHRAGLSSRADAGDSREDAAEASAYRMRRRATSRVASARYARGPGGEAARRKKALSRLVRRRSIVPSSHLSPPDQPEPQEAPRAESPEL